MGDTGKGTTCRRMLSFAALWTTPCKFTDVVVRTDSGASFRCHRAVLAARSAVMERMLDSAFKEAADSIIVLREVDDFSVEALLEFMYTGNLKKDADLKP